MRFETGQKLGHSVVLELDGASDTYLRTHLEYVDGLEERLRARLALETPVELLTVERPTTGEYAATGVPLVIHELRRGEERLLDAAAFGGNRWVSYVPPALGASIALAALALFGLAFTLDARARERLRPL